jgi:phosphate:Na+ symporter
MRRTAAAHVGYNLVTGVAAFLVLPLIPAFHAALGGDAPTTLVAFHTLFNVAGVVLLLPFIGAFARAIERIVPGGGPDDLPEPMDRKLLDDPGAALDSGRAQAAALAAILFRDLARRIRDAGPPAFDREAAEQAVDDLEDFLTALAVPPDGAGPRNRLAALNHLCDHLGRLLHRAGQDDRLPPLRTEPALRRPARALAAALERAADAPADPLRAARLARLHRLIAGRTSRLRRSVLLREAAGIVAPRDVFRLTDSLRWLERSCAHAERILHYGAVAAREAPGRAEAARA